MMGAPVGATHKVIEYSHALYKELLERATIEEQDTIDHDTKTVGTRSVHVFRGKFTDVWQSLGVSQAYYSKIRKVLLDNGCISIIQQGTRGVDTIMVLNHAPPEGAEVPTESLTRRPTFAILDGRVEKLEAWRESQGGLNIAEALRNIELRLSQLESKTGDKERVNGKA